MTTWKEFMNEIEDEAKEEGQEALDELESMKRFWSKQAQVHDGIVAIPYEAKVGTQWSNTGCMIEQFFKLQERLPPEQRATSCMISCPCPRCNPRM